MARHELKITVAHEILRDLLVTAAEGGSNYWAEFTDVERDSDLYILKARVTDREADQPQTFTVSPSSLAIGLQNLATRMSEKPTKDSALGRFPSKAAGRVLAEALTEQGDSTTADAVLQMSLFGEVLYG